MVFLFVYSVWSLIELIQRPRSGKCDYNQRLCLIWVRLCWWLRGSGLTLTAPTVAGCLLWASTETDDKTETQLNSISKWLIWEKRVDWIDEVYCHLWYYIRGDCRQRARFFFCLILGVITSSSRVPNVDIHKRSITR